jgi:hypothetical protein
LSGRHLRGGSLLFLIGVTPVVVGALVALVTNAATSNPDARWPGPLDVLRTNPWWSLLAGVAALVLFNVAALATSQSRKPERKSAEELGHEADSLRLEVAAELGAELVARLRGKPIEVAVRPHAADRGGIAAQQLSQLTDLMKTRAIRLAVVGGAGSGKSTALLHLAHELLDLSPGSTSPIPVVVNLSTWDPGRQRLEDVVRARISGRTQSWPQGRRGLFRQRGRRTAATVDLVNSGRVLPFLDGLDEIPEHLWEQARTELRIALAHPTRQFVFSCLENVLLQIVPTEVIANGIRTPLDRACGTVSGTVQQQGVR